MFVRHTAYSWLFIMISSCLLRRIATTRGASFISSSRRSTIKTFSPNHHEESIRYSPRTLSSRYFSSLSIQQETNQDVYQELKSTALEILKHDVLYYTSVAEISDDVYDALVKREEELCRQHPDLLQQWQVESGLGVEATRFGGRVGMGNMESVQPLLDSSLELLLPEERLKRNHLVSMLSLDNVSSVTELLAWLQRIRKLVKQQQQEEKEIQNIQLLTEPKLDGLSLALRYQRVEGKQQYNLQWATTRGNGRQGQDVTLAIVEDMGLSQSIALKNATPNELEVRGEVVLPNSAFHAFAEKHENTSFSNARNAASGILLRKKDKDSITKELRSKLVFYAYDLVFTNNADEQIVENALEMRTMLQGFGFQVPEPTKITTLQLDNDSENTTEWSRQDIESLMEYHDELFNHREGKKSKLKWDDYDMDGCVHKLVDLKLRQTVSSSNRAPRWAIAHKFPPITAVTDLLDITVQVGRTGALTPVAILKPVTLAGVVVQRATLHNFGHMRHVLLPKDNENKNNRLPRNCSVVVRRAGDVIPQVVQRVVDSNNRTSTTTRQNDFISLDPPKVCPACGSVTILDDTDNALIGQVLRCGGPSLACPPRAVSVLAHAFSRDALDITGLSEARIQQLREANLLKFPHDVFALEKVDLSELEGWGDKSATNLIRKARQVAQRGVSLSRFVYSLSIRHVGAYSSKLIASTYVTVDSFLKEIRDASESKDDDSVVFPALAGTAETEGIKGIGPVVLSSLVSFSKDVESVKAAQDLAKTIVVHKDDSPILQQQQDDVTSKDLPLAQLSVVFTGSIPNFTRQQVQEMARALGAKSTPSSISKSTGLVVAGEGGGKKLERAAGLGINIMNATDFIKLAEAFKRDKES